MLVAAWRASPALRERIENIALTHGCVAADPRLWLRHPCHPTAGGAAWSDGSIAVSLGEACILQCAAPTQRSLYVMHEGGGLVVSSSLPVLLALRQPSLSVRGLAACVLALGLPDRVPYAGIERVEGGHTWTYGPGGVRTVTALEHGLGPSSIADPEHARARLEAAIGSAVDGAIRGSQRVGILLSGGLDSSAVLAALAERVPASRIVPITWELGGLSGDRPFVAAWKARLGFRVEHVTAPDAARLLADSLVLGAAPTALMTGAFERAAMRRAKELGADVLLTGVGGDESFAGSLQAAVRSRATPLQSVQRALFAELPWGSTAYGRVTELVVRPALRPLAPRAWRERSFVRRTRAQLPALGREAQERLRDAARLHVGVVPPVPTTAAERFLELARRPFWLEMGELRTQLEAAEGLPRFDVPLDAEVHRAVASIEPHLLLSEHRHRGLLRRVLQSRAPQVVAARLDKADFDAFGHRILRDANVETRLRALARGTRLGELDVVPAGTIERLWSAAAPSGFPEDLTTFLGWWPFLSAEALAQEHRVNVEWLHEARSDEGGRFRIGRRGDTRIAEWDDTLRLEVGADGTVRIDANESLATVKLRAGAVPALVGHLTGNLHWHAAACAWSRGGAIVVLGDAGAGKSTLVAGLGAEAGASFLADDVAAIDHAASGWEVRRCEENHAMRPDMALAIFGHEGANKAVFSPERLRRRAPLGLVVSLETGPELSLQEMQGRQKVQLLTRNLVRFALDDAERLQRDLDVVLRIASEVPMYALVRPRPFSDWRGLARLLRSRLRGELGSA